MDNINLIDNNKSLINININWKGPYFFFKDKGESIFECEYAKANGIYIWTIPINNEFLPYYIGITKRTFDNRHFEHCDKYFSGSYIIYEPKEFALGERKIFYNGFSLRRKGKYKKISYFAENFNILFPLTIDLIKQFNIWVGPLEKEFHQYLNCIEGKMINTLYNQREKAGRLLDDGLRFSTKKPGNKPLKINFIPGDLIVGLPSTLEIE